MKRFLSLMTFAAVVVIIAMFTIASMTISAKTLEVSNNVVFVSDSAASDGIAGDGSSAEKPLDPYTVGAWKPQAIPGTKELTDSVNYLNTALYQAAEKLAETGGTIVICGPVEIGADESYGTGTGQRDFNFPNSDQPLRITSVYDGVDYAETNGAYLGVELPAQINMRSPSLFENMTIKTTGADRVICANGNTIVMGEGLTCTTDSGTDGKYYISVVGGSRYMSMTGDTDVTVKSGYYNFIGGSHWGLNGSYVHTGNVNITIEGGTLRNPVCGGAVKSYSTTLDGDVTINLYPDAQFGQPIYGSGQGQFASAGHKVNINIYGGKFYDGSAKVGKYYVCSSSAATGANYPAEEYNLNISDAVVSYKTTGSSKAKVLNNIVESAVSEGFNEIRYPAAWISRIEKISSPSASFVFQGGSISSEGARVKLQYTNAYDSTKVYQSELSYIPEDTAFKVSCSTSMPGTENTWYYYGLKCYDTGTIEVISSPAVAVLGAQIKTAGSTQGVRFVSEFEYIPSSDMKVVEYGVISVPADLFEDGEQLNFENTYGMSIFTPGSDDRVQTVGNKTLYTCTVNKVPQNRFNIDLIARAYVKLEYNGETLYEYSDIVKKNPYNIALEAAKSTSVETAETRTYLKDSVIAVSENYDSTKEYNDPTVLRQKVVDYMRAQMELTWTPSESFWIYNNSGSGVSANLYFEAGKTYKGIPYTNNCFSQKESFSDYITDGVLDISKMDGVTACGNSTSDGETGYANYKVFPGSDCSTAVITAWNTVLNSRVQLLNLKQTKYMVPGNYCGVVPVGDYAYDYATYVNNTYNMTGDSVNGSKVYAAYSLLQPGDAIVHYNADTGAGHARMVVSVDTSAKTVTTIECANWSIPKCTVTSGNGTKVSLTNNNTSWMELTYHFDYLLKDGYVPITIPELVTGNSDSEYTLVTDLDLGADLPEGKLTGRVVSNRQIISIDIIVSDGTTEQAVTDLISKSDGVHKSRIELSTVDLSGLTLISGKTYTFSMNVRVVGLSAKNPTVKLVEGYEFTAE